MVCLGLFKVKLTWSSRSDSRCNLSSIRVFFEMISCVRLHSRTNSDCPSVGRNVSSLILSTDLTKHPSDLLTPVLPPRPFPTRYDRVKCAWRYILDTQLICAMAPPGGARAVISSRTQSRFNVLNLTVPNDSQVTAPRHCEIFLMCVSRHQLLCALDTTVEHACAFENHASVHVSRFHDSSQGRLDSFFSLLSFVSRLDVFATSPKCSFQRLRSKWRKPEAVVS